MDDSKRLSLIAEAVTYCRRVRDLGMPRAAYSKALREPIFFLWEARFGPKIRAAKYRSEASLGLTFGRRDLVYDRAVPFKYMEAELLQLEEVTPILVRDVLDRLCVAAIVTREENQQLNSAGLAHTMPADWDGADELARYRAIGIAIVPNLGT